jgi:predicted transcriptional regulator
LLRSVFVPGEFSTSRHRAFRLPDALDREVEAIAARKFSNASQIVREALADYVQREQRLQRRRRQAAERIAAAVAS